MRVWGHNETRNSCILSGRSYPSWRKKWTTGSD